MTLLSVSILALLSRIMTDGGVRCGRLIGHRTIYYPHRALLPISLTDDSAMIILSRTIQKHFSNVGEGSFLCRGNKGDGVMLGFCLILLSPHLGCKDPECPKPKLGNEFAEGSATFSASLSYLLHEQASSFMKMKTAEAL